MSNPTRTGVGQSSRQHVIDHDLADPLTVDHHRYGLAGSADRAQLNDTGQRLTAEIIRKQKRASRSISALG
jgi:hypothetical protein